MIFLTREQRVALKRIFGRQPIADGTGNHFDSNGHDIGLTYLSYRQFRRTVQGLLGGQGCVMVLWCGMWLGIETDGHTHS